MASFFKSSVESKTGEHSETPEEPEPESGKKTSTLKKLLRRYRRFQLSLSPQQNLLYGFATYTLIGWLFLCIPLFHKQPVSMLDNLFVSTSAISTTGLVTVSVFDSYNFIGQLIIMLLFQVGGIGYMTFSSFIVMTNRNLSQWHQRVLGAEFGMPKGFQLRDFLKSVILFTFSIELIGAVCLFASFKHEGIETGFAIWSSIFHSISAFCTAGFGLYNNSFEGFPHNVFINATISVLAICGSLGFIVITDIMYRLSGRTQKITYTSKVIFVIFSVLLFLGTILIYFYEPSIQTASKVNKWLESFFQAMTAITTVGFNTVPIGNLSEPVLLAIIFLMYIGASPSGTGGGMKSTTLTALLAIVWNRMQGKQQVSFLGKQIPLDRLYLATAVFIFYTGFIYLFAFLLSFTERFEFTRILFETASALGTVGLSTGITGDLSAAGKAIIIFAMFIGRLGVITFGLALMARKKQDTIHKAFDDLIV